MPVCCSRDAATPPSMKTSPASTPAADASARRRASPSMPIPPTARWPMITASNTCIEAPGAMSADSSMLGVKSSDCVVGRDR